MYFFLTLNKAILCWSLHKGRAGKVSHPFHLHQSQSINKHRHRCKSFYPQILLWRKVLCNSPLLHGCNECSLWNKKFSHSEKSQFFWLNEMWGIKKMFNFFFSREFVKDVVFPEWEFTLLVMCYATQHPTLSVRWSFCRLVSWSPFYCFKHF